MSSKFIDAHEAARWVASGDTVCTVGMTLIGAAESILSAIEARFLTAGEPRDLTLLHAAGQSDRQRGIQHFAHPGMVTRLIGSHWGLAPRWMAMINNNEVEAWCLPQGQIVHLYSAMAAGLPGRLSPVGLGTFVDPRIEGGRMNARTRERRARDQPTGPAFPRRRSLIRDLDLVGLELRRWRLEIDDDLDGVVRPGER